MKKIFASLLALVSSLAFSATLTPVQLLNPAGSSVGQTIVSSGSSSAPGWAAIPLSGLSSMAANTVVANATGTTAAPTAFTMPSCVTALEWVSGSGFVCNSTGSFATLSASGLISPASAVGIKGTTAADNAQAGSIGEFQSASANSVSLTSGTSANVCSMSLAAGDWDIMGVLSVVPGASTTTSSIYASLNTTSATLGSPDATTQLSSATPAGAGTRLASPVWRLNISTTTTVYFVTNVIFSVSTLTANCTMRARRVR